MNMEIPSTIPVSYKEKYGRIAPKIIEFCNSSETLYYCKVE